MAKSLLRVGQVAEMLNVQVVTVYSWVTRGILPAVKLGKALRFRPEDIDEFIKQSKKVSA